MARLLRVGVVLSLMPLAMANYFVFAPRLEKFLYHVSNSYSFPEFAKIFSYHAGFLHTTWQALTTADQIAVLVICGTSLTTFYLVTTIMHRYFCNQDTLSTIAALVTGMLTSCASYGLLLLPILFSLFWAHRKAHSQQRIVEGQAALKDMWHGLFVLKLKLLPLRKNGIYLHEHLKMPRKLETRGIIIFGAPGSGKSHLIKTHFLPQLRTRGDLLVIFDYKGEFTQAFGEDRDTLIISPLDARSVIWNIARDIDTEAKAWEFVRMVVRQGDAPADIIFEDWARDLLTACLIKLQREKKYWTWRDFYRASQSLEDLIDAVRKYRPESEFAANFKGESRQFEAIKGTIRRAMARLEPLARAWGDGDGKQFSLSGWLNDCGGAKPTLIVRYDPLYAETMGPFVANFFNFLFASVLSLADSNQRRIWAVMDEFQTLPKIPKLFEAARAGRSKGLRMLLGTQDLGRIDQMYRYEGSRDTLVNLIGCKLIGHLGSQGWPPVRSRYVTDNVPARYAAKIDSRWLSDADRKAAVATDKTQQSLSPIVIHSSKETDSATSRNSIEQSF